MGIHNGNLLYMYLYVGLLIVGYCSFWNLDTYNFYYLLTFAFSFSVVKQIYKRLPKIMNLLEALISDTYVFADLFTYYCTLHYRTNAILMLFSGFKWCSKIVNTYVKRSW